jgi:hypothetical protein
MDKTEGVNYLSDAEYHGLNHPGPTTYNADSSVIQKKSSGSIALKMPIKGLNKSWRFEKSTMPDCGSYKVEEASFMQSHKPKAP